MSKPSKADLEGRVSKHAGGGHDQLSHGNWASGGRKGHDLVLPLLANRAARRKTPPKPKKDAKPINALERDVKRIRRAAESGKNPRKPGEEKKLSAKEIQERARANTAAAKERMAERGSPYRDRAEGLKREVGGADFVPKDRRQAVDWGEYTAITRRSKHLDTADASYWKNEAKKAGKGDSLLEGVSENPVNDKRNLERFDSRAQRYWEWRGLRRIAERTGRVMQDQQYTEGEFPEQELWPDLYKHYGGGHDQKSHGNWATGGGAGNEYRQTKWTPGGRLKRPSTPSDKRLADQERIKRLQGLGVLPTGRQRSSSVSQAWGPKS